MPKQYRVAVIGSTGRGDYGHALDSAWLHIPNTEIVSVCDDDSKGLQEAAQRLKVDRTYSNYRTMLSEQKPDIVAVCARWLDQHHAMVLAAAEFGCHVYMEKPMCRSLKEADDMVRACEKSHVKLAMAVPTRYSPRIQVVRKIIAEGRIGRVLEYRGRGKEDHRGGSEDLWVLGTHIMDMIRAIGGHPAWCFARVLEDGQPITNTNVKQGNEGIGPLAGDTVNAVYGMPDGSTAHFASVRGAGGSPTRYALQILGSKGIIEIREGVLAPTKFIDDPCWNTGRSKKEWQNVTSAGIGQDEPLKADQFYKQRHSMAITDLIQAIEEDRQPLASVYEARGATEMIAAVFESHRLRSAVELPLRTRQNPLTLL